MQNLGMLQCNLKLARTKNILTTVNYLLKAYAFVPLGLKPQISLRKLAIAARKRILSGCFLRIAFQKSLNVSFRSTERQTPKHASLCGNFFLTFTGTRMMLAECGSELLKRINAPDAWLTQPAVALSKREARTIIQPLSVSRTEEGRFAIAPTTTITGTPKYSTGDAGCLSTIDLSQLPPFAALFWR